MPELPHDAIARGAGRDIGLLIGATRDEALVQLVLGAAEFDDERVDRQMARAGLDDVAIKKYQASLDGLSPREMVARLRSDVNFRVNGLRLAETRAALGGAPVYHYDFAWGSPALGGIGASHCVDVPFVFDVLADPHAKTVLGDTAPQSLADAMHAAFTRFVTGGSPWEPFDASQPTMVFDATGAHVERAILAVADEVIP